MTFLIWNDTSSSTIYGTPTVRVKVDVAVNVVVVVADDDVDCTVLLLYDTIPTVTVLLVWYGTVTTISIYFDFH